MEPLPEKFLEAVREIHSAQCRLVAMAEGAGLLGLKDLQHKVHWIAEDLAAARKLLRESFPSREEAA